MVQVVYRVPRIFRAGLLGTLVLWILLLTYVVVDTNPPVVVSVIFVLPALLLAWIYSFVSRGVSWEVDPYGFKKSFGARVVAQAPWTQIATISAHGSRKAQVARLSIVDTQGRRVLGLVPGPAVGYEDVRTLYESAAYFSKAAGITAQNNLGWGSSEPQVYEKQAAPHRERIIPHVSVAMVTSGILILITGTIGDKLTPAAFGVVLAIAGVLLFGGTTAVNRSLLRSPTERQKTLASRANAALGRRFPGPNRRIRHPWAIRLGVWIPVALLYGLAYIWYSVAPVTDRSTIILWIGLAAWAVVGRLALPLRDAIRGRRPAGKTIVGYGGLVVILAAVLGLTQATGGDLSPFSPLLSGFAGFWLGMALFMSYEFLVNYRLRLCIRCSNYRWFLREKGRWYGMLCGHELEGGSASRAAA